MYYIWCNTNITCRPTRYTEWDCIKIYTNTDIGLALANRLQNNDWIVEFVVLVGMYGGLGSEVHIL